MESTRRPLDRSLAREPGLKKPRLTEELAASNGRAGFIQRQAAPNPGGGSRVQRDRDSESSDSVRGLYQHQTGQQLHQELVNQYKTALAELTFNSKPIITNLTIIAGENLHAAKAIAATVCANILEVPSEQKLPSLYLLDSIVKNIGRDYIKHFGSRLPEVFCKAYRQVDPSVHNGMRHLFGTWKGVFPPQSLQMIERELGFSTSVNGSSSGTTTSRPDSQAQRPAHSIHVNPKYLEARQRLQTPKARGAGSDVSGAGVNSNEDVEALERTTSINSGRSWADSYAKPIQHHHRDQVNEPVRGKSSSIASIDSEYGSSVPGHSGLGTGTVSEKFKDQGFDRPWHESGRDISGKISNQKNGFDMKHGFERYIEHKSENSDLDLQLKQNIADRSTNGMSRSWKNSEEEEYVWDGMNSRPTDHTASNTSAKDRWAPDNYDRLDYDSHLRRPQSMHETGLRFDDEASVDSISTELGASGPRVPLSWSKELHPQEEMRFPGSGNDMSGYSEEYLTGLKSSANSLVRTPHQPQLPPAQIGASSLKFSTNVMPGPKVSTTWQRHTLGAPSSSAQSPIYHPSELLNNLTERSHISTGPPTDPRRPPGLRNTALRDELSQDYQPLPSRDVYRSTQRLQPQSLRTSSAPMPPLQQRKQVSSAQQRKPDAPEFESSGEGPNLLPLQNSISESQSTMGNSSSDQSNPLTIDSPGRSITSSLLSAVAKSGILSNSAAVSKPGLQVGPGQSLVQPHRPNGPSPASVSSSSALHGNMPLPVSSQKKLEQPPLPAGPPPSSIGGTGQNPSTANSTSHPVSSLLSSLVAKGLISASKSDSLSSASTQKTDRPLDRGPGVASTSSTPVSSVSVTAAKPVLSSAAEPFSLRPSTEATDDLAESRTKIKNLIGFEFRPNVIRNMHPDVISDLFSELPHQCGICGLKLKLQERLDRHMEWHALRAPEQNTSDSACRRWYANSLDWVAGNDEFHDRDSLSGLGESDETLESIEQMVPADESQCACIVCGELFEDFYNVERKEWMFKGAIYLTSQPSEANEKIGITSDTASPSPIVHANCISEVSVHDLGLTGL